MFVCLFVSSLLSFYVQDPLIPWKKHTRVCSDLFVCTQELLDVIGLEKQQSTHAVAFQLLRRFFMYSQKLFYTFVVYVEAQQAHMGIVYLFPYTLVVCPIYSSGLYAIFLKKRRRTRVYF